MAKAKKKKKDEEPQDEQKVVESVIANIEKQFGAGSIMQFKKDAIKKVPTLDTGSISLNQALGVGGYPFGRVVEIYGPESSGKTTATLHAIAEAQKRGLRCAFVDAEHALDPVYADALGVDMEALLLSQPDSGEQALEITERLVSSGAVQVVVIDSVAALVPQAELDGEMGDTQVGLQARLMSKALRKLTGTVSKHQCIVFFINQTRMKIGVMFGSPLTTSGGNALKFYASVRLQINRIGQIKQGDQSIGNRTRIKVVKNKLAPPFRECEFDILFGKGISRVGELLELGVEHEIVEKAGAWFSYDGSRLGQGRPKVVAFLEERPELCAQIEAALLEKLNA